MNVTVAIPAFDEVGSLAEVVSQAINALGELGPGKRGEVLIVEDGSTDGTAALADRLASELAAVRVIHHASNRGFSGAMRTCLRESLGDWIFLVPADGQTRIAELPRFLEAARDADIVVGVRASPRESLRRVVLSRGFHTIARVLFDLPQREFSSSLLFRRALLDAMPFRSRPRAATLLPEILFRARRRQARIATLDVPHLARIAGRAKGGQLSVALLTLLEMVRLAPLVRWDERRAARSSAGADAVGGRIPRVQHTADDDHTEDADRAI